MDSDKIKLYPDKEDSQNFLHHVVLICTFIFQQFKAIRILIDLASFIHILGFYSLI